MVQLLTQCWTAQFLLPGFGDAGGWLKYHFSNAEVGRKIPMCCRQVITACQSTPWCRGAQKSSTGCPGGPWIRILQVCDAKDAQTSGDAGHSVSSRGLESSSNLNRLGGTKALHNSSCIRTYIKLLKLSDIPGWRSDLGCIVSNCWMHMVLPKLGVQLFLLNACNTGRQLLQTSC